MLQSKDWEDWWYNPCTQQFLIDLGVGRQGILEAIAAGSTINEDNAGATAMLTAKEIGRARGVEDVMDLINGCKPEEKDDAAAQGV